MAFYVDFEAMWREIIAADAMLVLDRCEDLLAELFREEQGPLLLA